jgi:diphthine-ammonia ligase
MMSGDFAMMWSGGKDSCLALARAMEAGLRVNRLINFYDIASERIRFHAFRKEIVVAHAASLGLHLTQVGTDNGGYGQAFQASLNELKDAGYKGVVFGNIHLRAVRDFCEAATSTANLKHIEPLWDSRPIDLVTDFVSRGFSAVITCCELNKLGIDWLGREVNPQFIRDILSLNVDACGENGEYHSCVTGGPLFRSPLCFRRGRTQLSPGFAQLDVVLEASAHLLPDSDTTQSSAHIRSPAGERIARPDP